MPAIPRIRESFWVHLHSNWVSHSGCSMCSPVFAVNPASESLLLNKEEDSSTIGIDSRRWIEETMDKKSKKTSAKSTTVKKMETSGKIRSKSTPSATECEDTATIATALQSRQEATWSIQPLQMLLLPERNDQEMEVFSGRE